MNKSLRYIAILAILPLFTAGLTVGSFDDAYAIKAKGVGTSKYGSATAVCGVQLCSEIPGGKSAWDAQQEKSTSTPVPVGKTTETEEKMMVIETEKNMMMAETESMMAESDMVSELRLSRTNVPAEIPLHKGYFDGGEVYFIITDSSDPKHADIITENQGWKVELAPLLEKTPKSALSNTYFFTNGISGSGVHGYQGEVFTSTPEQSSIYSALTSHTHVTWNDGFKPRLLDSEDAIMTAQANGEVELSNAKVVLNMPQIIWPGGQMMIKEDKTLTDETPYGGGQILDINTDEMTVTFIAHRGWGPDGRTIYYIVTDATPSGPAGMMGVTSTPTSANLIANAAAVDLFQFKNGLKGTGPLGFQPGIATGAPGDANYSPMWRIFVIGWNDASSAQVLETIDDINAYKEAGLIDIGIARPMDSDHIVNCPFIDPFQ